MLLACGQHDAGHDGAQQLPPLTAPACARALSAELVFTITNTSDSLTEWIDANGASPKPGTDTPQESFRETPEIAESAFRLYFFLTISAAQKPGPHSSESPPPALFLLAQLRPPYTMFLLPQASRGESGRSRTACCSSAPTLCSTACFP